MLDIFVGGEKQREVHDRNPVLITTDRDCERTLLKLKNALSLTNEESQLIDRCLATTCAKVGDDIPFGPGEIFELAQLAMANPDYTNEIMACSEHLSLSLDCDGDLPDNIFLMLADAHAELCNISMSGDCEPNDDDSSSEE